jgi:hypothetical protein
MQKEFVNKPIMRWRVNTGIYNGHEFEGHPIVINRELRIWDNGTMGNSYPANNCEFIRFGN